MKAIDFVLITSILYFCGIMALELFEEFSYHMINLQPTLFYLT